MSTNRVILDADKTSGIKTFGGGWVHLALVMQLTKGNVITVDFPKQEKNQDAQESDETPAWNRKQERYKGIRLVTLQ